MKKLFFALVAVICTACGVANAQTYKPTYATSLFLSGGGSPITPLIIQSPTLSSSWTMTLPGNAGSSGQFLQTNGSGVLTWASASLTLPLSATVSDAGVLFSLTNSGMGGAGLFAITNAGNSAAALAASTNGTGPAIQATGRVQITDGNLVLANTGSAGELRLQEPNGTGSDYTAFKAQDQSGNNITYTLPAANGTAGQSLRIANSPVPTATAATLEWGNPAPGGAAGGDLTGNYPNPDVAADAIGSAEIADNTITGADILNGTVDNVDLANDAVTASKIAANAVNASEIGANAVGNSEMEDDAIGSAEIINNSVASTDILDNTITNADIADNTIALGKISSSGAAVNQVVTYNGTNIVWATLTSNDWSLTGNSGTTAGTNFLGTTDNQAFEIRVDNGGLATEGRRRVMRFEPNAASPNIIGGFNGNSVTSGVVGATVAGGGSNGAANTITDDYGVVSGGRNNRAGDNTGTTSDRFYATVGGGLNNVASHEYAVVAGGQNDTASGANSFVGGGNTNRAIGSSATVVGGLNNRASNSGGFVGGGANNHSNANMAIVVGGENDTASGQWAFVGGGYTNVASGYRSVVVGGGANTATNNYATVGGGIDNDATGQFTTVAGGRANGATADYATVSGGQSDTASAPYATIGGGFQNNAAAAGSFIGSGSSNRTIAGANDATIGGGAYNYASGYRSTIGGGESDTVTGSIATIGGGFKNYASGDRSTIGGGESNLALATAATVAGGISNRADGVNAAVGGGRENFATGANSAIPGGRGLTLDASATRSFGFHANNAAGTLSMTISAPDVAVFGNTDLWLANNDNNPSELRFFEGYNTAGAFPSTANYSAFKAQNQTSNITYVLPDTIGVVGDVLQVKSVASGTATLDWAAVSGGSDWSLTGNSGTTAGTNFLGTTDNQAFEIRVDNGGTATEGRRRVMRFEPNATSANIIGGFNGNTVTSGAVGATISGGGANSNTNVVTDDYGVIGGGRNNQAGDGAGITSDRQYATVGGGSSNTASGSSSTVGGGLDNTASGAYSTAGGGFGNHTSDTYATVGGGSNNTASGLGSTAGGGQANTALGANSTVGGGHSNAALGTNSTVGGGLLNTGSGDYSAIPGGNGLTLDATADRSFGFHANNAAGTLSMTISAPDVAVFGNTDLWLANNDNNPSELRFFEGYNTAGAFPSTANYSAFKAQNQTSNITYVLPDTIGVAGDVLQVKSVASGTATLDWASSFLSGSAGGDLTGSYPNPSIAASAVTSAKILDSTITTADISPTAAIPYSKLVLTNSIQNGDIVANAVTTSKVANGTVITSKLSDSAVSGLKLLTFAVENRHIADGAVTLPKLSTTGASSGQVITYNGATIVWGNPSSDWSLTGNSGTTAGTNFLGTTDNQAFEIRVDNGGTATEGRRRVMRFEPNTTSANIIGGFNGNSVTSGVVGAVIDGGGANSNTNRVTDDYGVVGGGANNQAGDNAGTTSDVQLATVGGGNGNTASGFFSTIGGGNGNTASGNSTTVGGGDGNEASGVEATIAGGLGNTASGATSAVGGGSSNMASGLYSTVGGGLNDTASGDNSAIGGGQNNTASGDRSTVGGGESNTASSSYSTVGGGINNTASGSLSTVGGGFINTASDGSSTVGGGSFNTASGNTSTVGGGGGNTASSSFSTVGGGNNNTASGSFSTVGGGLGNTTTGDFSTIPGGIGLTLDGSADRSFGFHANNIAQTRNMTISTPDVAVFGNTDLWLANNDNNPSELRFFEAYNTAGSFPNTANYSAFKAQNQSSNITYILPDTVGIVGDVLQVKTVASGTATLDWAAAGSGGTVSTNATLEGDGTGGDPLGINLGNSNTWTANQIFAGTFLIAANSRIALTNSDNNPRDIRWQEPSGTGTQYIGFRAPSVTNNGNYVWPAIVGSVGQVMAIQSTNGIDSATLHWKDALTWPFTNTANSSSTLFDVTNSGSGQAANFNITGAKTASTTTAVVDNDATNTTTDGINKTVLSVTSSGDFSGSGGTATNATGIDVSMTGTGGDNNTGIAVSVAGTNAIGLSISGGRVLLSTQSFTACNTNNCALTAVNNNVAIVVVGDNGVNLVGVGNDPNLTLPASASAGQVIWVYNDDIDDGIDVAAPVVNIPASSSRMFVYVGGTWR